MFVSFTVKEYSVTISNFKLPYAYVMLYDADGKWRARLNFSPKPAVNETTDVTIGGDFIEVDMNIDVLDEVVDLLRNEKPVTVSANSSYDIFLMGTGKEPVGEEESRAFRWIGPIPLNP